MISAKRGAGEARAIGRIGWQRPYLNGAAAAVYVGGAGHAGAYSRANIVAPGVYTMA